MAAAAGDGASEARARALLQLQNHQPFAPLPGEYHHFGAPAAAAAEEMVEAVVLRTPVSSGELVVCWSRCAEMKFPVVCVRCSSAPVYIGLVPPVGGEGSCGSPRARAHPAD